MILSWSLRCLDSFSKNVESRRVTSPIVVHVPEANAKKTVSQKPAAKLRTPAIPRMTWEMTSKLHPAFRQLRFSLMMSVMSVM